MRSKHSADFFLTDGLDALNQDTYTRAHSQNVRATMNCLHAPQKEMLPQVAPERDDCRFKECWRVPSDKQLLYIGCQRLGKLLSTDICDAHERETLKNFILTRQVVLDGLNDQTQQVMVLGQQQGTGHISL